MLAEEDASTKGEETVKNKGRVWGGTGNLLDGGVFTGVSMLGRRKEGEEVHKLGGFLTDPESVYSGGGSLHALGGGRGGWREYLKLTFAGGKSTESARDMSKKRQRKEGRKKRGGRGRRN